MTKKRVILGIGALAAAAIAAILAARANGKGGPRTLVLSGVVEQQEIHVGSKESGRVTEVLVEEGDSVHSGQPLVRLDLAELKARRDALKADLAREEAMLRQLEAGARPEEISRAEAELASAEASAQEAKLQVTRKQPLVEKQFVTAEEFDAARYRAESLASAAEAQRQGLRLLKAGARAEEKDAARARMEGVRASIRELETRLAEEEIRAPVDARVEVVSVRPGDLVRAGGPLVRILEPDRVWVRIYVPEPHLGRVRVGQKADVKVDTFPDRVFPGTVQQIRAESEFTPRNIQSRDERHHQVFGMKVRVENPKGEIKSGMAADVTLPLDPDGPSGR